MSGPTTDWEAEWNKLRADYLAQNTALVERGRQMASERSLGKRILSWVESIFGKESITSRERATRVVEEAIELAQAEGISLCLLQKVTNRVFSRPAGSATKEASQLALTLWAYCESQSISPVELAAEEADRVESLPKDYWQKRHDAKRAQGIAT
jgi:hypothetical protein